MLGFGVYGFWGVGMLGSSGFGDSGFMGVVRSREQQPATMVTAWYGNIEQQQMQVSAETAQITISAPLGSFSAVFGLQ